MQAGNFAIPSLDEAGPREVVKTTSAFNDMTGTLQAVEAKAVALSAEDLSDPQLTAPLPGQTGLALQATIDHLAQRIQEREAHRQQLHDAATHDRLTGLFNRGAVFDYLTTDVSRRRLDGETVAVLFVDLAQRKINVQDLEVPLTASVGVALSQCGADADPMELVRQADHAMYEAKKAARTTRELATFRR